MASTKSFVGVSLPAPLAAQLRRRALQRGWTVTAYVARAVEAALESEDRAAAAASR